MIRNWIGIFFFILTSYQFTAYSQSTGDVVVLLQGKIYDNNGKPVKVKVTFFGSDGKNISTTSNSTDGFYQQVLKPGVQYNVSFAGYLPIGNSNVDVPNVSKYTEISSSFTVRKIEEGLILDKFSAFDSGDSTLTNNYIEKFSIIESFLKANITASLVVTVSVEDSYFLKKRVRVKYKDKKGRSRSKRITLKPEDQLMTVLEARLAAVKDYIGTLKVRSNKVSFQTEEKMGPKPPKKKKKRKNAPEPPPQTIVPNIKIVVGKIINM